MIFTTIRTLIRNALAIVRPGRFRTPGPNTLAAAKKRYGHVPQDMLK